MKEKIKEIYDSLKKNWKIVLIVILVLSWFGWYKARPSIVYSYCHKISKEKTTSLKISNFDTSVKFYEQSYKQCLRSKGINK